MDERFVSLNDVARKVRKDVIRMIGLSKDDKVASSMSVVDVLVFLYWQQMDLFPNSGSERFQDRLVMSKGHSCAALYSVLAAKGYFEREHLWSFRKFGGFLQGRPDFNRTPGVNASIGAPGLGLGIAIGMALADSIHESGKHVYCVVGDGELSEGTFWESVMIASSRCVSNLTLIVDVNRSDSVGGMDVIKRRFEAFGWKAVLADGHDFGSLEGAFEERKGYVFPTVILARTMHGKGVSFMEKESLSSLSAEQREMALAELDLQGEVAGDE